MTSHKTGTPEEWLTARLELLQAEKELTRRGDELSRLRRELPWVRIDRDYRFDTDEGTASLADLFRGRSQLLVYHFMFGPDYTAGCPSCSAIADGFSGSVAHLANHDVTLCAVSRAPLAKIRAYKARMGWSFPFASSYGSDFNYDFQATHTKEAWDAGAVKYNFGEQDLRPPAGEESSRNAWTEALVGTDWETYLREGFGMSAFALEDGAVYHTYSAYGRGLDAVWGMYPWLDRAPLGRNETGMWWRRHDGAGGDPGRAGGRVRAARCGSVAGTDRGQLPAAARRSPGADPAAAAAGSGRPDRRPGAGVAGSQAAGNPGPGGDSGRGGRAGRVRRPGGIPSSAGPLGGLPVGVTSGPAGRAPGTGGGYRSGGRPGPPGLAPGPGRGWAG
jgi:predicted dithiol-disulfide oxidoreductase (DUF899 family)